MCSINDSNATYFSEVEELIKVLSTTGAPLRRSQRLSQKAQVSESSWKNKRITTEHKQNKSRIAARTNKCTPNIFSSQDLKEEQALYGQQYNLYLSDNLSWFGEKVEGKKDKKYFPLDLSKKSKFLTKITSPDNLNNVAEKSKNIKKDNTKPLLKRRKPQQIYSKSKISTKNYKVNKNIEVLSMAANGSKNALIEPPNLLLCSEKNSKISIENSKNIKKGNKTKILQNTQKAKSKLRKNNKKITATKKLKKKAGTATSKFSASQSMCVRSLRKNKTRNQSKEKEIDTQSTKIQAMIQNIKSEDFTSLESCSKLCDRTKTKVFTPLETCSKSFDATKLENTTLEMAQKSQNNEKTIESLKMKLESVTQPITRKYIKYFNKDQFIDKIQGSTTYTKNTSTLTNVKYNPLQIPLTPADSTQELCTKSILPEIYPSHFKYQLPFEAVIQHSLDPLPPVITPPNDTISSELSDSPSSSPSLPESLCKLFQTKDIKDILGVERVAYRLYDYHIQALALILNLNLEFLCKTLDKIIKIKPSILKNLQKAMKKPFVTDYDLFATTPEELRANGEIVSNSQSPKQRRMAKIDERDVCLC